ncbi:MAG TPA: hypothetical protein VK588_06690, partial [Chitinophagaceae bacterium]|nr:hypothetical protein [Chitinophagaceae bacterium]
MIGTKVRIIMICSIEWSAFTSKKNVYRLCRLFNMEVRKGYNSRRELLVKDEANTWKKTATNRHLFIEIRKQEGKYKLTVRGSLHKFYHGNNKGSFDGWEVMAALSEVYKLFEIAPGEAIINKLEVGINLPVWFKVFEYLKKNLLYHKKKLKQDFKDAGIGFVFKYEDYLLKLYQK